MEKMETRWSDDSAEPEEDEEDEGLAGFSGASSASRDPDGPALLPRGPKGGRTTRTRSGMVRKSLLIGEEEARALRREAYLTERSEAEIVREALRRFLGLPLDPEGEPPGGSEWEP